MLKELYEIEPIDYKTAMEIVVKYHYLHRPAPCSHAFCMKEKSTKNIVGVVVYGVSSSSTLLKGICGVEEMHNVYELTRLWIKDGTPKNSESWLIGNTIKRLDKEIIVSFAERDIGHCGTIYQASNFLYCGLSAKFIDPVVSGLENKHHSTFAHGMTKKQIVEKWGGDVRFVERPRKHRYIFFNAKGKRKKELLAKLKYPIYEYPHAKSIVKTGGGCADMQQIINEQSSLF